MSKRRLGRGIDALLQGRDLEQMQTLSSVVSVPIDDLVASPNQPRKNFSSETLRELADSIREKGVIQPILAEQRDDGTYEIIAGERRWRAAQMAGLEVVPVLPRSFSEEEKLEIALIENIQRQDLNPIEEARAYESLRESTGLTQVELAKRLGLNRVTIANAVRLLKLPQDILDRVEDGQISAGHARALLQAKDEETLRSVCDRICNDGISVRLTERLASGKDLAEDGTDTAADASQAAASAKDGDKASADKNKATTVPRKTPAMLDIESRLLTVFGTKVSIIGTEVRGHIQIDYHSMDDLDRICEIMLPKN